MKPHYRLVRLCDCAAGTRFYLKNGMPGTLITLAKRYGEAVYHIGHLTDYTAKQRRVYDQAQVWVEVFEIPTWGNGYLPSIARPFQWVRAV